MCKRTQQKFAKIIGLFLVKTPKRSQKKDMIKYEIQVINENPVTMWVVHILYT